MREIRKHETIMNLICSHFIDNFPRTFKRRSIVTKLFRVAILTTKNLQDIFRWDRKLLYLPWIQTIGKVSSRIYQTLRKSNGIQIQFKRPIGCNSNIWLSGSCALSWLSPISSRSLLTKFFFKKWSPPQDIYGAQVVLEHGYKRNLVILSVYYLKQPRNNDGRVTAGDNACIIVF